MKTTTLTHLLAPLALAAVALAALPAAYAQTSAAAVAPSAAATQEMADGEVRRIDKAQGKVTLRHGEIRSLEMPPMTMVFALKDPAWADRLKVGDKVRFVAEKDGGRYTVTQIESAR